MEKLAPGRFSVTISGEARTIVVSFGMRAEILRAITKKQLEYRGLTSATMLPNEMRAELTKTVEALDMVRNKKAARPEAPEGGYSPEILKEFAAEDARIEELQADVNRQYEKSIETIDANKDKVTEALTYGMIDLTDDAIAEILSIVLTERDEKGKQIRSVSKEELMYAPTYVDASEELLDLVEGIMEYMTASLKKMSAVSEMVTSLVRPS